MSFDILNLRDDVLCTLETFKTLNYRQAVADPDGGLRG